jgi:hypothetical protein
VERRRRYEGARWQQQASSPLSRHLRPDCPGRRSLFVVALLALLVSVSRPPGALAAFENCALDSKTAAMGGCWSVSLFSAFSLAPVPPKEQESGLGLSCRRLYGMDELAELNLVVNIPFRGWCNSIGIAERGWTLYKERIVSAAVSARPQDCVFLCLSLSAFELRVDEVGSSTYASVSVGARTRPVRGLEVCVGRGNFVSSTEDGAVPEIFLLGLLAEPSPILRLALEARKNPRVRSSLHFGAELEPAVGLLLRCGLKTEPLELTVGFGLGLGNLSLETASAFHPVLGRTDSFTCGYAWR